MASLQVEPVMDVEVAVWGATSAGVCAAVAAAERGAQVALIEAGGHVGGMTSGGLGWTDLGVERVIGGFAARFRKAVADHYGVEVGHFAGPEPHVAESILLGWLESAGVEVLFGQRLYEVSSYAGRISQASFIPADGLTGTGASPVASGKDLHVRAGVWIDASYEGDLLALAGCSYAVGREDATLHDESLAGRQELLPGRHNLPFGISPFADDPTGRHEGSLLPGIHDRKLARVGTGDGGVMSYGYRLCLSQGPGRIPFIQRDGYDPSHFELFRRLLAHYDATGFRPGAGWFLGLTPNLPGGKSDGNSLGPFSLSLHDASAWDYPEADAVGRERIRLAHLHHAQDFCWFLSHDKTVPAHVREEFSTWGLSPNEFTDTAGWPHQLYVREARRLQGEVVLTQADLQTPTHWPDTIAMGSYHIDIREVQRTWRWAWEHPDPVAHTVTEGYLSVAVPPYQIPYRALLPRREECANLLVPVCVSSSAVAFSSIRMEPQYQMLGQAAGLAAAIANDEGCAVHDVKQGKLRSALLDGNQVLAV